jgi:hypothetical protein
MIRIAITAAAYQAIARHCPRTRLCGPCSVRTASPHPHRGAVLDRLGAMRGLGASYSDVVLGLVER